MRTKLLSTVVGLVATALLVIACQPMLSSGEGRGSRPVSAQERQAPTGPSTSSTTAPPAATVPPTTIASAVPPTSTTPPPPRPESPGGDVERHWYGSGPRVAVLGDSLTVQARAHLRDLAEGSYALKVGALYGEGISGGALSIGLPDPLMPAVLEDYAGERPDVVVMALGTNDVWRPELGLASFERRWHEATRRLRSSCVVGVTVTETDQALMYDSREAEQVNRVIRRTVDVVVDWNREGASSRYTDTDHIHLTPEGRLHFAELVMAGVAECESRTSAQRPTAPSTGSIASAGSKPKTRP